MSFPRFLLSNEHICTLALWFQENFSLCESDTLKQVETTQFMFSLFEDNRNSYDLSKPNTNQDINQDDFINLDVESTVKTLKEVVEGEYHKRLMPCEIGVMVNIAHIFCVDSEKYSNESMTDDRNTRGKLCLIQELADELNSRDEWQGVGDNIDIINPIQWRLDPIKTNRVGRRDVFNEYDVVREAISMDSFANLLREYDSYQSKEVVDIVRLLGVEGDHNNNEIVDAVGR